MRVTDNPSSKEQLGMRPAAGQPTWMTSKNMRHYSRVKLEITAAAALVLFAASVCLAGTGMGSSSSELLQPIRSFRTDRILVKPKKQLDAARIASLHAANRAQVLRLFARIGNLQVVRLPADVNVQEAIAKYQESGLVEYAEPDYTLYACVTEPNDPYYLNGSLWGLKNAGQYGGTPDADIDAPEAWDTLHDATNVVVAVLDTGVRYTHEDLAGNMWRNPGEIAGNGVDDDRNGYVDDVYGINSITGSGNPNDDSGHGTHVAGTIGAIGNNAKGVVGVAWRLKIMACKLLDSSGEGNVSDAIECIEYACSQGAQIMNGSWNGKEFSQALKDAIIAARDNGAIVVASAGNSTSDNDSIPAYPACFDMDNIVSVAATDRNDSLASFSNYGLYSVDLAAPGVDVTSAWRTSDNAYRTMGGTSMAAPYVAGALALLRARFPGESYVRLIGRMLNSVDRLSALDYRCVTGGRLNLRNALTASFPDLFVTPTTELCFGGMAGGPFTPARHSFIVYNCGTASLNWTAAKIQDWLSLSSNSGTLGPGESVTITVTLNTIANGMLSGTYPGAITFTNTTNGSGNTTRGIRFVIGPVCVRPAGNDLNDGSSWTYAKKTVQTGLRSSSPGVEVWVAAGVYLERITLKNDVALYGGFAGTETLRNQRNWSDNASILDGGGGGSVVTVPPGVDGDAVLDGFTIRNGSGIPVTGYSEGGGIFCNYSSPTISNNHVTGNTVSYRGAGIYCYYGSPTITGNKITGNQAAQYGGGIYSYGSSATITSNTFASNTAPNGGGITSNGTETISNNIIAFGSSGVYKSSGLTPTLRNNCVFGNTSYNYSGLPSGTGDISQDPLFTNRIGGDYHLSEESPCVNAGWNAAPGLLSLDWDREPRLWGGTIDIGFDEFTAQTVNIPSAKRLADGRWMATYGVAATVIFPNAFYIETDDRSCGIRVQKTAHGMVSGMRTDVTGKTRTNPDGERYIEAATLLQRGPGQVEPLSLINRSLGGGDWFYDPLTGAGQKGVAGAGGLNNIGLWVRSWGNVTEISTDRFWVEDGSAVSSDTGHNGVRVDWQGIAIPGSMREDVLIHVTGISSCIKTGGGQLARRLLPGGVGDVVITHPRNTLMLNIPAEYRRVKPGQVIEVLLYQTDFSDPLAGYQAFLEFDSSMLSVTPADITMTSSPYGLGILKQVLGGSIDLAAGVDVMNGQPFSQSLALLATLRFTAGSKPGFTSIGFRASDPATRVTDANGYPVSLTTLNSPMIEIVPDGP